MQNRSQFESPNPGSPPGQQAPAAAAAARAGELTALFGQALALHQAGRLAEAEPLYRRVLQADPRHSDSLHLLGVINYQRGEYDQALRQISAALAINPNLAAAHNNLGTALNDLGRFEEALASYDRAIALQPDYADAFSNRANVLKALKRFDEALADYDRAIALHAARPPE